MHLHALPSRSYWRFASGSSEEQPAAARLERDLDDQVQRAVTRAFRDSFLIGAGLALVALLTVAAPRRRAAA